MAAATVAYCSICCWWCWHIHVHHCQLCIQTAAAMQIDPELVKLYMNASVMVKDAVAREFNLLKPLYFSYTHLVCRTAKEG